MNSYNTKFSNITYIDNLEADELDVFRQADNGLLHYYEPKEGLFIAESPIVTMRALDAGYKPISILMEESHVFGEGGEVVARCRDIPIYVAPFDALTKITGFQLTRGLLCAMQRKPLLRIDELCEGKSRIAVLESVVNPTNVGAIVRSAAALGMEAVILTGGSCDPLYRRAIRVSMGTIFQIPWTVTKEDSKLIQDKLKAFGYKTVAMALSENSVNINDEVLMRENKLAVYLGAEGNGLSKETISDCDYTVCIPMSHGVDSLNVAAASAVAFWQLGRH